MSGPTWIADAFFRPADGVDVVDGPRPGAALRLVPFPSRGRARVWLEPQPRVAASALLRYAGTEATSARVARLGLALAARAGALRIAGRGEAAAVVRPGAAPAELLAVVREALGCGPFHVAVTIGSPRPNRKPVVHLLDPRGRSLGYLKVGWNPLTRGLVETQADALGTLAPLAGGAVRVPELLARGVLDDLVWAVESVLPRGPLRRALAGEAALDRAHAAIAGVAGIEHAALAEHPYLAALAARVDALAWERATGARLHALLAERHGASRLSFGAAHGDFAPWNYDWDGARLLVWDWERFARGVPVGFDLAHHVFQMGLRAHPEGLAAVAAGAALARRLEAAGGAAGTAAAVLDLYLLDIWLRYASDAAGNGPLAGRCAAIADYLERKPSP